jgi:hypothetical protein
MTRLLDAVGCGPVPGARSSAGVAPCAVFPRATAVSSGPLTPSVRRSGRWRRVAEVGEDSGDAAAHALLGAETELGEDRVDVLLDCRL